MNAIRIHWHEGMAKDVVRAGISQASDANVGRWMGFYAQVAIEGVKTVLTIDTEFDRFDAFETEMILSPNEFSKLNRFLGK